jgi:hypothetical protein
MLLRNDKGTPVRGGGVAVLALDDSVGRGAVVSTSAGEVGDEMFCELGLHAEIIRRPRMVNRRSFNLLDIC